MKDFLYKLYSVDSFKFHTIFFLLNSLLFILNYILNIDYYYFWFFLILMLFLLTNILYIIENYIIYEYSTTLKNSISKNDKDINDFILNWEKKSKIYLNSKGWLYLWLFFWIIITLYIIYHFFIDIKTFPLTLLFLLSIIVFLTNFFTWIWIYKVFSFYKFLILTFRENLIKLNIDRLNTFSKLKNINFLISLFSILSSSIWLSSIIFLNIKIDLLFYFYVIFSIIFILIFLYLLNNQIINIIENYFDNINLIIIKKYYELLNTEDYTKLWLISDLKNSKDFIDIYSNLYKNKFNFKYLSTIITSWLIPIFVNISDKIWKDNILNILNFLK